MSIKTAPGEIAVAVTPSDTVDLPKGRSRGLYVGVTGNVAVHMSDDESSTSVTFTGLVAGVVHPLSVKRVLSTATTATGIVAIY